MSKPQDNSENVRDENAMATLMAELAEALAREKEGRS